MRLALVIYGILNAILYASLLPLWDGFDEPFHYGYVQNLARHGALPKLGETFLSEEIWQSLSLAPGSARVKQNLPLVMTFDEYFRLSSPARAQLRFSLASLPPSLGDIPTKMRNYEAQHPPLAYAPLALADLLLKGRPLLPRAWLLRLICAITAVLGTAYVTFRLGAQMEVPPACANAALFVVLSSQMFYGAAAHIANDWLAIPLFALVISFTIDLYLAPSVRSALGAALALAAGLLTKSYFLALLPMVGGVLLALAVRRRLDRRSALVFTVVLLSIAGPWYMRNYVLYGNWSGMQETGGGVPAAALLRAAWQLPWMKALVATARTSLWTGNNSFTAYSAIASYAMIGLIVLGVLLWAWRWTKEGAAGMIAAASCLCYAAALAFSAVLIFWSTRGEGSAPSAWYAQVLLIPGWCLIFAGFSHAAALGRLARTATIWLWAYVICSTYFAKLIPFYAGYPEPAVRLARLLRWYWTMASQPWDVLNDTAIMPASLILILSTLVFVVAVVLAARLFSRA